MLLGFCEHRDEMVVKQGQGRQLAHCNVNEKFY